MVFFFFFFFLHWYTFHVYRKSIIYQKYLICNIYMKPSYYFEHNKLKHSTRKILRIFQPKKVIMWLHNANLTLKNKWYLKNNTKIVNIPACYALRKGYFTFKYLNFYKQRQEENVWSPTCSFCLWYRHLFNKFWHNLFYKVSL